MGKPGSCRTAHSSRFRLISASLPAGPLGVTPFSHVLMVLNGLSNHRAASAVVKSALLTHLRRRSEKVGTGYLGGSMLMALSSSEPGGTCAGAGAAAGGAGL
jgi:hypothetical protein